MSKVFFIITDNGKEISRHQLHTLAAAAEYHRNFIRAYGWNSLTPEQRENNPYSYEVIFTHEGE